ncbi:hypothetical protein [Paenibacillus prosopidis]|uniref:WYL domain-containing protein n=1 Tax=Paenibacillus prosopidis TaxID=630520 RepID=A0A368VMQ8_9BACL|nr:hypothetical protein [Paenibacillus prosopidis]RCW40313.1 hypothetical protein DFP97_1374 [Paenibacillus prosopidis]
MIENYIDRTVQIFYQGKKRNISIRLIRVQDVPNGKVKAFCYEVNVPRIFNLDHIIDVELVKRHA